VSLRYKFVVSNEGLDVPSGKDHDILPQKINIAKDTWQCSMQCNQAALTSGCLEAFIGVQRSVIELQKR